MSYANASCPNQCFTMPERPLFPQALTTSLHARVKNEDSTLYISSVASVRSRSNKRNTKSVNYAEIDNDRIFMEDGDDNEATFSPNDETPVSSPFQGTSIVSATHFEGKPAVPSKGLSFDDMDSINNASIPEIMIPVRVNVEHNGNKVVDFFMWNANETLITPEAFAVIFCSDLSLPSAYASQIALSIKQQISEYINVSSIQFPAHDANGDGLHAVIHLSFNLGRQLYEDRFEWDLSSSELTPEEFAAGVVADMGLPLEFVPAIAHALNEQILRMKKEFIENQSHSALLTRDISLQNQAYQSVPNEHGITHDFQGLRYDSGRLGKDWTPSVETLSHWEMEKKEIERERNIRRLKRESVRIGDDAGGAKKRAFRKRHDELDGLLKTY